MILRSCQRTGGTNGPGRAGPLCLFPWSGVLSVGSTVGNALLSGPNDALQKWEGLQFVPFGMTHPFVSCDQPVAHDSTSRIVCYQAGYIPTLSEISDIFRGT